MSGVQDLIAFGGFTYEEENDSRQAELGSSLEEGSKVSDYQ